MIDPRGVPDSRLVGDAQTPHLAGDGGRRGHGHPARRISEAQVDALLASLEVDSVSLSECVIGPGQRLTVGESCRTGLHYVLAGSGRMTFDDGSSIPIAPHTLVVLPSGQRLRIDGAPRAARAEPPAGNSPDPCGTPRRSITCEGGGTLALVCGSFRARHGRAVDLFADMASPAVECFEAQDLLDDRLRLVLLEQRAQEVGTSIMTASLTKQILVKLFRRALTSSADWAERLPVMSDPNVSRAFADMVSRPGGKHSVKSLAQVAGLSRSTFMQRFTALFGRAPMTVLRELRMRQAATMLSVDGQPVDRVAQAVGYSNRSSFYRAFRTAHGVDPSTFRASVSG